MKSPFGMELTKGLISDIKSRMNSLLLTLIRHHSLCGSAEKSNQDTAGYGYRNGERMSQTCKGINRLNVLVMIK